jgi:hypothetical protein
MVLDDPEQLKHKCSAILQEGIHINSPFPNIIYAAYFK